MIGDSVALIGLIVSLTILMKNRRIETASKADVVESDIINNLKNPKKPNFVRFHDRI